MMVRRPSGAGFSLFVLVDSARRYKPMVAEIHRESDRRPVRFVGYGLLRIGCQDLFAFFAFVCFAIVTRFS